MTRVRVVILVTAAVFFAAASLHWGMLIDGYAHEGARIPETVIGLVLLAGAIASSAPPPWGRRAALAAQIFALLGVGVGVTMIAIGIGPRSALDFALHATMTAMLLAGLVWAWGARA
jgi:hypothetical protein